MARRNGMSELWWGLVAWAVPIVMAIGWITHLVVCFTENRWGFLLAGAIVFPIAIFHGWGRIFGWW